MFRAKDGVYYLTAYLLWWFFLALAVTLAAPEVAALPFCASGETLGAYLAGVGALILATLQTRFRDRLRRFAGSKATVFAVFTFMGTMVLLGIVSGFARESGGIVGGLLVLVSLAALNLVSTFALSASEEVSHSLDALHSARS
jgi:hypothetical protein